MRKLVDTDPRKTKTLDDIVGRFFSIPKQLFCIFYNPQILFSLYKIIKFSVTITDELFFVRSRKCITVASYEVRQEAPPCS
jgi:hypothetical protein